MRPLPLRLLLLLLAACLAAPALAEQLYRWVDDDGVVHYTDRPPPEGRQFETRALGREADSEPLTEATPAPEMTAAEARCVQLRANLAVFESSGEVAMDLDGDGVPERLDAAARQRELERTRELIAQHCAVDG